MWLMMSKLLLPGDWNSAGEMTLGLLPARFWLELAPVPCPSRQGTGA